MNINSFCDSNDHIMFLPGSPDIEVKRKFINTCDAMIYGRKLGESWGLSIGEFAICGKPIIIPLPSHHWNHITFLKNNYFLHRHESELIYILDHFNGLKHTINPLDTLYHECTPERVMKIFNDTYLS